MGDPPRVFGDHRGRVNCTLVLELRYGAETSRRSSGEREIILIVRPDRHHKGQKGDNANGCAYDEPLICENTGPFGRTALILRIVVAETIGSSSLLSRCL